MCDHIVVFGRYDTPRTISEVPKQKYEETVFSHASDDVSGELKEVSIWNLKCAFCPLCGMNINDAYTRMSS